MKKRGQVTLFIVLGLALLIGVVLFFFMRENSTGVLDEAALAIEDEDARNVYIFVKDCLRTTADDALFYFGYNGGNVNYFPMKYEYPKYSVPYYFYEGVSYMPTEEDVDDNILSEYVRQNLDSCISGFDSFSGLEIVAGDINPNVLIAKESVIFELDYPVSVYKGENVIDVGPDFRYEKNLRLKDILAISRTIVENELTNELFIHWDYMTDMTRDDFSVTAYTEEDNTIVYRIIDERNQLYDEDYLFQFANKFYIEGS